MPIKYRLNLWNVDRNIDKISNKHFTRQSTHMSAVIDMSNVRIVSPPYIAVLQKKAFHSF